MDAEPSILVNSCPFSLLLFGRGPHAGLATHLTRKRTLHDAMCVADVSTGCMMWATPKWQTPHVPEHSI